MLFSERADQIFKEFMYEKSRNKNKNNHPSLDKKRALSHLSEVLGEMEDYIDEKLKDYQILKKNKKE